MKQKTLRSPMLYYGLYMKGNLHSTLQSRFGGVVVSVIATGTEGRGFKPDGAEKCLIAIKIRSSPSFGWEIKPEAPCRKILRHAKEHSVARVRCYANKTQGHFSPPPWVTARCLWCSQRALVYESGVLELRRGRKIGHKMAAVLGTLCSTPASNSIQ
jgi:hypothetical protein